ncbi:hypothetical protein AVEN_273245-1 [Araneus ventricosus]|uniref:Uncharacterized protein n=1 Tax=Araneus ventricosus TaxID=182803 RepID=A0A4Y2W8I2_ARAVE|nr:hypothetical protein AVEN_273245-1 [Araneus ventricosus]
MRQPLYPDNIRSVSDQYSIRSFPVLCAGLGLRPLVSFGLYPDYISLLKMEMVCCPESKAFPPQSQKENIPGQSAAFGQTTFPAGVKQSPMFRTPGRQR